MMNTAVLERISDKVLLGEKLTADEAQQLAASHDILALGSLADRVRRQRHGTVTTFLRVAEIALDQAGLPQSSPPPAARELRLTGPVASLEQARKAVRAAASSAGSRPVTGFSLARLEALAADEKTGLAAAIESLRDEGLAAVAEAPVDALIDCPRALAAALAAGVRVDRLTVDAMSDGILAVVARADAACRTDGMASVFAPLARRPSPEPTTGYEDVRTVALARILLGVDRIQVDWRLHGPKLAQVALTVGADDVDNVSPEDEGPEGRRRAPLEEILRNIRAAGLEPAERDSRFAPVR
jgi:aminodeoxyfutalosine synthase